MSSTTLENSKDLYLKTLAESKSLSKREKHLEALHCLDKLSKFTDLVSAKTEQKLAVQTAKLCNKLSENSLGKVGYLRRAEQVLVSWMSHAKPGDLIDEKIIRMLLLTYFNWAIFHQNSKSFHISLNYLMKGLQIIDENSIQHPNSLEYVAKTKLGVSHLYFELRQYSESIKYAEDCLATLQKEVKIRLGNKEFKNLEGKEKVKAEVMIRNYVTAFYTIGIAQDYLNHKEKMIQALSNAVNMGTAFLSPDNQSLIAAKKALEESGSYRIKNLELSVIKNHSEAPAEVSRKNKANFSLSFGHSKQKPEPKKQEKIPGKYYSEEKLKILNEKLEGKNELDFVSADQFFYKSISKIMNVSSDIQYLRPLTTSGARSLWDKQLEEQLKISDLRLKKQRRYIKNDVKDDFQLQQDIERLKVQDEEDLKKQDVKMRSKMNTKIYKQLITSISKRDKKYMVPAQRLHFKPPFNHRRISTESSLMKQEESKAKVDTNKRLIGMQTAKDEIENLMAKISGDIKKIDVEKGISKAQSPDVFITCRDFQSGTLANSTQKNSQKKKTFKFLKNSIEGTLRPEVRRQTNSRIILRTKTLTSVPV